MTSLPALIYRPCWKKILLLMLISFSLLGEESYAQDTNSLLNADLDRHLVKITAGFTGSELLIFGATQGSGEIITTVTGPPVDTRVTRKGKKFGIWLNEVEVTYSSIPSFYAYAVSGDKALDLPQSVLTRHSIGPENLSIPPVAGLDPFSNLQFRRSLIRNKVAIDHYQAQPAQIERRGPNLFRAKIHLPANVPIGTYSVQTLLIQDQNIVSAQVTPLFVSKVGWNSKVYYLAHEYPFEFGIAMIIGAALAGFAANIAFRRR